MKKGQFCGFLKAMFSLLRKACLLYETSKIVFSRFLFTIYEMGIQGVTWAYWGLQGITGSYKGLQRVTRGYRRLQWVTRGYMGLQGVTRGDRGLQGLQGLQGVTGGDKGLQRIIETFFYLEPQQTLYLDLFLIKTKDEKT